LIHSVSDIGIIPLERPDRRTITRERWESRRCPGPLHDDPLYQHGTIQLTNIECILHTILMSMKLLSRCTAISNYVIYRFVDRISSDGIFISRGITSSMYSWFVRMNT
jgi:hypothetical protein